MMNVLGPFILVLTYSNYQVGGLSMQEFPNRESCEAAIVQLDPVSSLHGYCIAKEVIK